MPDDIRMADYVAHGPGGAEKLVLTLYVAAAALLAHRPTPPMVVVGRSERLVARGDAFCTVLQF